MGWFTDYLRFAFDPFLLEFCPFPFSKVFFPPRQFWWYVQISSTTLLHRGSGYECLRYCWFSFQINFWIKKAKNMFG
ncbi:hypothetical protein CsSME_00047172 [Camellia sinensis var. sinensis]